MLRLMQRHDTSLDLGLCSMDALFNPTGTDVAVNAPWYLSLSFGLLGAFSGIPAKQWVREFHIELKNRTTLREQMIRREVRLGGMEQFHFATIVESIPMLGFVGLLTFVAGLVIDLFGKPRGVLVPSVAVLLIGLTILALSILHGSGNPTPPRHSVPQFFDSSAVASSQDFWSSARTNTTDGLVSTRFPS